MASSGEERLKGIANELCIGGLLHPKGNPSSQPCALCFTVADLLFGEAGIRTTLVQIKNELGAARSVLQQRR